MGNATEEKFGDPGTRIAQTARWTVLLRPKQPTLGALALVCREPATAFGALSVEAFAELRGVIARSEAMLKAVVEYQRINYLMLMMVDPDVHFHVIPRYEGSREFGGHSFADAGWPGQPALEPSVALDPALREALGAALRAAWARAA